MLRFPEALLALSLVPVALAQQPLDAQDPAGLDPPGLAAALAADEAIIDVIARTERSVVAIARVQHDPAGEALNFEIRRSPFALETGIPAPADPSDPDFFPSEYATGVVVDRRGLILTAYHVLEEDSDYYVTTSDGKVYRAWVKGADPRSDLAVLAIEADDLTPMPLGDSSRLRKGQTVIALGNPHAIARDGQVSASRGMIANLSRKIPPRPTLSNPSGKSTLHHFGTLIQTDAKLNLGVSGGALVDLRGEMVGLTTSLAASAGYETAAGYAFPVDDAFRRALDTLKQGREVEYGFLGVRPQNLTLADRAAGLRGIRIDRVERGTPAERYGLRPSDLVTAVNGVTIHNADGLVREVGALPVESTVRLHVVRRQRELQLDVVLTKYPVRGAKVVTEREPAWRGINVDYPSAVIDEQGSAALGLWLFDEGVVVSDVQRDSPAWEAGVRPYGLISRVGDRPIHNPREFRSAVSGTTGSVRIDFTDGAGGQPAQIVVSARR